MKDFKHSVFTKTWCELTYRHQGITSLTTMSQSQKDLCCMRPPIQEIKNKNKEIIATKCKAKEIPPSAATCKCE